MLRGKNISLYFRVFALIFIIIGLLFHLHVFYGTFRPSQLMYYTLQSNVLAVILFIVLIYSNSKAIKEKNEEKESVTRFEMVCVIDLLLTFFVYWIMLAPKEFERGDNLLRFANLAVHFFTPIFCIADYFIFAATKKSKYKGVYYALIFPLSYVLYSSIAGLCGYTYGTARDGSPKHYPYFFMDYDRTGSASFLYIVMVAVILILIGHIVYYASKKVRTSVPKLTD
jgi:hypothetical protein